MTSDAIARARRTTRRRATTVCLALAALTAAVAAAVISAAGPHRADTTPLPATATSAEAAGSGRADLPRDLVWSEVAGIAVPVSTQSGPYDTDDGLARGFAHDPAGAVLAAVHILVRVSPQVGPSVFAPTLQNQVVGAGAATMRVQVQQAYDGLRTQAGAADGRPLGRLSATLRGYRIISYRVDEAVLHLLIEAADAMRQPVWTSTEIHVRWTGSDWALLAPPGGTFDDVVAIASASDVASFQPFAAGR